MPLTEEEKRKISEELQAIIDRDKEDKPHRKTRKEYISNHKTTLQDLLYNEVDGEKKPRPTDVHQGNIDDCYLLGNLIHLAKTDPNFIMEELINVKKETPNQVIVSFFKHKNLNSW